MSDKSHFPDFLKKVVAMNLGSESLKQYWKDIKLPKDLSESVVKAKTEMLSLLTTEFQKYLNGLDLKREIPRILEDHTLHIEISLKPKSKKK